MEKIKEIGIIGSGKMGTDIFNYLSGYDYKIKWAVNRSADADGLYAGFKRKIDRNLRTGLIPDESYERKIRDTGISSGLEILKDCDLLIECITEELEDKKRLFSRLEEIVKKDCIFSSNTSSFKPSRFFPGLKRKDKFVCLHFFYPVKFKDIAELIVSKETSISTTGTVLKFLKSIKKTVLIQNEENAFFLTRAFLEIQVEAFEIFTRTEKTIGEIDDLVKNGFSSFGAFELMDNVGIKTIFNSMKEYVGEYENAERYHPLLRCLEIMAGNGINGFYAENFIADRFKKRNGNISFGNIKNDIRNSFLIFADDALKKGSFQKKELDYALKQFLGTDFEIL